MSYAWLGPEGYRDNPVLPGYSVRIRDDLRKSVVFIGTGEGDDFAPGGTGFWVLFDGFLHLVTAKHNAVSIGDAPFTVRMNLKFGGSAEAHFDLLRQDITWQWYTHEDDTVDAAVIIAPFDLDADAVDYLPLSSELFLPPDVDIGIGDNTYTVGLFRRMHGKKKNFPVVHSGCIAAMPSDELVPVQNWDGQPSAREVEAYLVEQISLGGLSGAPVFVRSSVGINGFPTSGGNENLLIQRDRFYLMGLWHGAWDAPPDEILRAEMQGGTRAPVGMGVVVPIKKIAEVLQMSEIQNTRDEYRKKTDADALPTPDFVAAKSSGGDDLLRKMLSTPPKPKD